MVRVYVTKHTTDELVWEDYVIEVTVDSRIDGFEINGREIGEEDFKPLFYVHKGRVYNKYYSYGETGVIGTVHVESV